VLGGNLVESTVEDGRQRLAQRTLHTLWTAEENEHGSDRRQAEAGQPSRQQAGRIPFDRVFEAGPSQQGLAYQQDNGNDVQRGKHRRGEHTSGARQDKGRNQPGQGGSARPEP